MYAHIMMMMTTLDPKGWPPSVAVRARTCLAIFDGRRP